MCLLANATLKAQNKTEFSADQWSGCGSIYVQFINQSTPAGGTASWDFGDGGAKSSIWNPGRSFNKPGKYTVTLTVTFPDGSKGTVSHDVTVYKKPEVSFTPSVTEGCTPLKVDFTDHSSAGDGTITSISWDFGEGTGATGPTASHTYERGDNIKATSIVTNSFGCTNSGEQQIKVKATPQVAFTSDNRGGCKAPVTVSFTNNTTLNTTQSVAVTYAWDFGDGSTSTDMNPTHQYTSEGSFTVSLTATTADGCKQTLTEANYVVIAKMQADFTVQEKPCKGTTLHFTNTTQPAPQTAVWTFSDGSTINGMDAVKQFTQTGDVTVTMSATTADGCQASTTKTIHIADAPQAAFTIAPATACTVPVDVQFTSQSTGATAWQWTLGDGATSTDQSPQHRYTTETTYNIKLVALNAEGCADSATKSFSVRKPQVSIAAPGTGCVGEDVAFTSTISSPDPVTKYTWDFGDGGTASTATPTHRFTKQGAYTVKLTIETQGGCTQTATTAVQMGDPVNVDFTVDRNNGCQPTQFSFTNTSTPKGTEWMWVFEDGTNTQNTSTEENPKFTFHNKGKHAVTLTVTNNGCARTLTKPDFIEIYPPVATFITAPVNCADVYQRSFTDRSDFGGSTTKLWHWDFGDGTTSTDQNPTHKWTAPGVYTVTLTADNSSCQSSVTTQVKIIDEKPVIHVSAATACRMDALQFSHDPLQTANFTQYKWVWGDGTSNLTSGDAQPSKAYSKPGIYKAHLEATDLYGCVHSSDPVQVTVYGADPGFTMSGRECKGDQISFTDNSTPCTCSSIVSWTWDFGDGTTITQTTKPVNYQHTYDVINKYPVKLTVKDDKGCESTKVDTVRIANVVARFGANSTYACLKKDFQFSNFSVTEPLTYAWDFGDGGTSAAKAPVHQYTTPGKYTVKLDIRNSIGCKDHVEIQDFITVPNPVASFTFPPVAADVCPPVKVQFTNNSTDYVRSEWTFGDGSSSIEQTPLHNYIRPGDFNVTLTVYAEGNCASDPVATQTVHIAGPDGTFGITPETGCWPLSAVMTAQSPTAKKYIWDFGDGYSVTTTTPTSPSYTYPQEGVYFPMAILEDARGCKVPARGSPKVVADRITANFSADVSKACDGGTVYFKDLSSGISPEMGLPMTYQWDFGTAGATGSDATPTYNYTQVGTYQVKLTATSYYGCVKDTTLPITVEARPAAEILPIAPICVGKSVQLQGRDNKNLPNTKWMWTVAPDKQYAMVTPPRITLNQPGNTAVKLTIATASGMCSSDDNKFIEVSALPALSPTPKASGICRGASLQLQANTTPDVQVTWTNYNISDPRSASPTVTPDIDTVYHVLAENAIGCISEDNVSVKVSQPFKVSVNDAEICAGKNVQLHATGAVSYKWTPAAGLSNPDAADPIASPEQTTTYQVTGYGNDDCFTDVKQAVVTVHPVPTVNAGPDISLPVGSNIQIPAQGSSDITKVEWWPPSWLSCADCLTPVATPKQTTTYHVTVTNQFGCVSMDEVNIQMVCESGVTFLPNSFSPNGDGQNDIFYIRGKGIKTVKSFRIYNRWGQLVFERANFNIEDPAFGWDGRYKGALLNPDVYIYAAELVCESNETFMLKGDVMLLR